MMINKDHILVVDDEFDMAHLISSYLVKENYKVSIATNGYDLLEQLKREQIDLIVLDIMMPEMDGFTACRKVRETSNVPIIMLTAKGEEIDRVHGLKIGADDYVVKPFSPKELVARIEALLRRTRRVEDHSILYIGPMAMDQEGRTVKVEGETVVLTRKEYDLLLQLVIHKDKALTREQLLDLVWGIDYLSGTLRTVDTHIKTLRIKLGKAGQHITTVWGVGYKLLEHLGEQNEN